MSVDHAHSIDMQDLLILAQLPRGRTLLFPLTKCMSALDSSDFEALPN